jgi:transposase
VINLPKYVSNEKRNDIIFHKQSGKENPVIAEFMRVCVRTVERVWSDFQATGKSETKVQNCGRKSVITAKQQGKIIAQIKETPDITLLELIEKFTLPITEGGLSKYLKKLGYSFKKRQLILQRKTARMSEKNAKNS